MPCSPEQSRANGAKSKGRPPNPESEHYRKVLRKRFAAEAEAISKVLIDKAKGGDVQAIKEINSRMLGNPTSEVDITSAGQQLPTPILNVLPTDNGNKEAGGTEQKN